jgi:DNA-3-methyladenine glycosylase
MLQAEFFERREPRQLARDLLGKVLRHRVDGLWLSAAIIETEAYLLDEPASHSSLGLTPSRQAMWMPPGTVYMYFSRGGDSLNVSALGDGNAVLIKSAVPRVDERSPLPCLRKMQELNPTRKGGPPRDVLRLCAGQTLLCRALGLRVGEWNGRPFDPDRLVLEDVGLRPAQIVETRRLGIPADRDQGLPYRFVDLAHVRHCTRNPLTVRAWRQGVDYRIVPGESRGEEQQA